MNLKPFLPLSILIFFSAIGLKAQEAQLENYAASILQYELRQHVKILASDSLQGREAGTPGGWMAGDYIASYFEKYKLKPAFGNTYFQYIDTLSDARNVVGIIEGTDAKQEAIVIGAHYDHHGFYHYAVYGGADDNASGVAALLSIAKAMSAMQQERYRPKRTVIFIAYDSKELSMKGSQFYVDNPVVPLKQIVACLNMDMLGRIDALPAKDTNYLLIVGADKHKSNLKAITDFVNFNKKMNLDIDYTFYNSKVFSDMFYRISDQYNFGKHKIPVLYFTSGMHDDLWKPGDKYDRLSYPVLQKRAQFIFYTLWWVANDV
ncbi:MAG: M28 family peptidase [Prevotellaceae bacterium]|jgi:Zn-dependent M28 family amino/carboxypeptidase|nr:M28 family peptidase [Prevotellaceae bacterium]